MTFADLFRIEATKMNAASFSGSCVVPLGMESVAIADEDLSASTSFDGASVGPQNAR